MVAGNAAKAKRTNLGAGGAALFVTLLLSLTGTMALSPPTVLDRGVPNDAAPVAIPAAADPCPSPAADPNCAQAIVAGSGCTSVGLILRGLLPNQFAKSTTTSLWGTPNQHTEAHVVNQALVVARAKAVDSYCDSQAPLLPSACGRADATDVAIDLLPVGVNVQLSAEALREDGCADLEGGTFNHGILTRLTITLAGGTPTIFELSQPANTVVNLGALGFVVINEQAGGGGACVHSTGNALRVVVLNPLIEVIVGWVSTIACKLPSSVDTTSIPSGGLFSPGLSVRDDATVTGLGLTPTGLVSFFLCQPVQTTPAGCPAGGALVSTNVVDGLGLSHSAATSNTIAGGKYCWRAEYLGSSIHLPSSHTNPTTECFTVKFTPTLTTLSTPTPSAFPGQAVRDTATITGAAPSPPSGAITFFLCLPTQVIAGVGCPTGGAFIGTVALAGSQAVSPTNTNTLALGTYCWRAEYPGDANYVPVTHTNFASECFTVAKLTPGISTLANPTGTAFCCQLAKDKATLTATGGAPLPTGSVRFLLCKPPNAANGCLAGGTLISTNVLVGGVATSGTFDTNTSTGGKHCWRAEYLGDSVYNTITHTNATSECFDLIVPQ